MIQKQLIRLVFTLPMMAFFLVESDAQVYFPPAGPNWETMNPISDLNWCPEKMDSLKNFLEEKDSKGFLILKDGRIAVEWYFGTFTQDSIWYWASAGKSLTATLIGVAQQEGLLDISEPSSLYLGDAWSSCTEEEEEATTIWHHLTMSTGMDDSVDNSDCTDPECLICIADPGTRWAYHNAPYTLLESVISSASGVTINQFLNSRIGSKIGGLFAYIPLGFNRVVFSRVRDMARFGLLIQAGGQWNGDVLLTDTTYFQQMTETSQNINKSYGYLWWLNGKGEFMLPGLQLKFPGNLIATAPPDMFAALGLNDQKLYVVPSQGLVIVRLGNDAGGFSPASFSFDNELWDHISNLDCTVGFDKTLQTSGYRIAPNPAHSFWEIMEGEPGYSWQLLDQQGRFISSGQLAQIAADHLPDGTYYLLVALANGQIEKYQLVKMGGRP